ncbi:uncharacterized protein mgab [Eucyclogobius newberryi]|uniref:uncharacterized protein mgab n=1 Tax=Eucyclogobius newberryi TaxID=166745 RepID=UPI003B5A9A1D
MHTTDSAQDLRLVENRDVRCSLPPNSLSSAPTALNTVLENRAPSMANADCGEALSSPAEASPAKPASTSPSSSDDSFETSPSTSHIASAADSLQHVESSVCKTEKETGSSAPLYTATPFGDTGADYPNKLTFKGITVTLESGKIWHDFYKCGTEMILTKQGRHMFPYCRYRISGLDPERMYTMVLSVPPADALKYRWSGKSWAVSGQADHLSQGLIRAYSHHYSPCTGAEWMKVLVSFKKLKVTNNSGDQEGNIILHSLHRYIPRLHVVPAPDSVMPTADQPVVVGPESMTFTFPQTEFMAVTTYQNFRITQMKIRYNPFAKGFRENGNNPRLHRVNRQIRYVSVETPGASATAQKQEPKEEPKEVTKEKPREELKEEPKEEPTEEPTEEPREEPKEEPKEEPREEPTEKPKEEPREEPREEPKEEPKEEHSIKVKPRLTGPIILKPIMSPFSRDANVYVHCRGKRALGNLVVVPGQEEEPQREKSSTIDLTPPMKRCISVNPKAKSSPSSSPKAHKYKKYYGWRKEPVTPAAAAGPPHATAGPPNATAVLDDVEGLLFVSFITKAALDHHLVDQPVKTPDPSASQSPTHLCQTKRAEASASEDELVSLEARLLKDLHLLKHRQTLHPVLQEVGLKLSSLDPSLPIDLQYLGVQLPLPPKITRVVAGDAGLAFISRTGKTSDVTKIKGWRNKFVKSDKPAQSDALHSDGSGSKNFSAFCSDMLDEYLESEERQISERAETLCSRPPSVVAYELPAKSASYVRTLDSVLRQRAAAPPPAEASPPSRTSSDLHSEPLSPTSPAPSASPALSDCPVAPALTMAQRLSKFLPESTSSPAPELTSNPAPVPAPCPAPLTEAPGLSKPLRRLREVEREAWDQGLKATQLTPDRLKVALSALVTKWTELNEVFRVPMSQKPPVAPCVREFCRLGCVCNSLHGHHRRPFRASFHCRRLDCMFGCSCYNETVPKNMFTAMTEPDATSSQGSQTSLASSTPSFKNLWIKSADDSDKDPVLIPKATKELPPTAEPKTRIKTVNLQPPPPPPPVTQIPTTPANQSRMEDKDLLFNLLYLESKMSCARVREFNYKPPAEQTSASSAAARVASLVVALTTPKTTRTAATTAALNTARAPHASKTTEAPAPNASSTNSTNSAEKTTKSNVFVLKKKLGSDVTHDSKRPRTLIEIQSACKWANEDRKLVLEALCVNMNRNRLCRPFTVGPYHIQPVAKIVMQKPNECVVTYKVRISLTATSSHSDSDEEKQREKENKEEEEEEKKEEEEEECEISEGSEPQSVGPFLSGIQLAGVLKATTAQSNQCSPGPVQVNGKFYSHARLMLGRMGSLHPANRVAAFVTGRLGGTSNVYRKPSNPTQPAPSPAPNTALNPAQSPTSPPAPNTDPNSVQNPAPNSASSPAPSPVLNPVLNPAPSSVLNPAPSPVLNPAPRPAPNSAPRPAPNSAPRPAPNSAPRPAPNSAPRPAPNSALRLAPNPAQKPAPSPVPSPASSPASQTTAAPPTVLKRPLVPQMLSNMQLKGLHRQMRPVKTIQPDFGKPVQVDSMPPPPPPRPPSPPAPAQRTLTSPFHRESPISITVSPSLKTPSFLGQKGSFSFRICPPDSEACKLPGVPLPGGFTMIQLPKPAPDKTPHSDKNSARGLPSQMVKALGNSNSQPVVISDYSESSGPDSSSGSDFTDEDGEVDVDDELSVDVETVQESEEQIMVDRLRLAAGIGPNPHRRFVPKRYPLQMGSPGGDGSEYRRHEKKCSEQQRRDEHRELFDGLQHILEPGTRTQTPKLHLLTLATKEIKSLTERCKHLEDEKRLLSHIQKAYVQRISLMSGKPEEIILDKLNSVCGKQTRKRKMSDSSYSDLLRFNAAMVQAISPPSRLKPGRETTPLLKPIKLEADEEPARPEPSEAQRKASEEIQATAKNFLQQLLTKLKPIIDNAKICHYVAKNNRPIQAKSVPPEQKPVEVSTSSAKKNATTTKANDSTSKPPNLALPLIRSKAGRIILPSNMKPAPQTFYTLTLAQNNNQGPTLLLKPVEPAFPAPVKRGRGRPRKNPHPTATRSQEQRPVIKEDPDYAPAGSLPLGKRPAQAALSPRVAPAKRGRPPKSRVSPRVELQRCQNLHPVVKKEEEEWDIDVSNVHVNGSRPLTRGSLVLESMHTARKTSNLNAGTAHTLTYCAFTDPNMCS